MVALGGVAVYLGWLSLPWPLIHDAPIMHYIAWRIGEGAVPYRDVFDMNFPGVYLVHLGVLRTLGAEDAGWRIFDLAWLALTSALVAALAARWGRLAAAGGALFFAAYHLGGGAWQAGQRDFILCAFLLAGALGVSLAIERGRPGALVLGGAALGAGLTIKPHAIVFAAALLVLVALAPPGGSSRLAAAGVFAAGLAVVPVAVGLWLAMVGGLGPWREIVFGYLLPLYSRLGRSASWVVYRWALWPAIALVLALTLGHALAEGRFTIRRAVAVIGLAYGLTHFVGQGKGWEYHLYPLAAFAGVLLFSEVDALVAARRRIVAAALLAGLAALVVVLAVTGAKTAEATWIWDKERVVRLLTVDLQHRVRPGDTVQVLDTTDGGIHALLRAGVAEPTRFVYDFHFFHDTESPVVRALRAELLSGLDRRPPRYVVVFRHAWPVGGYERLDGFPELRRLLTDRYVLDVERPTYTIHAHRGGP